MSNPNPIYYLPIRDPNTLLENCLILLKNLAERIIEHRKNGRTNYTDEAGVTRVKVVSLYIEFHD